MIGEKLDIASMTHPERVEAWAEAAWVISGLAAQVKMHQEMPEDERVLTENQFKALTEWSNDIEGRQLITVSEEEAENQWQTKHFVYSIMPSPHYVRSMHEYARAGEAALGEE